MLAFKKRKKIIPALSLAFSLLAATLTTPVNKAVAAPMSGAAMQDQMRDNNSQAASREHVMQFVMNKLEGNTVNPNDGGHGPSKYGVVGSFHNLTPAQTYNLPAEQATNILKPHYWDGIHADSLPDNMKVYAFSDAMQFDIKETNKLIALSHNNAETLRELSIGHYQDLVSTGRYNKVAKGWDTRLRIMDSYAETPTVELPTDAARVRYSQFDRIPEEGIVEMVGENAADSTIHIRNVTPADLHLRQSHVKSGIERYFRTHVTSARNWVRTHGNVQIKETPPHIQPAQAANDMHPNQTPNISQAEATPDIARTTPSLANSNIQTPDAPPVIKNFSENVYAPQAPLSSAPTPDASTGFNWGMMLDAFADFIGLSALMALFKNLAPDSTKRTAPEETTARQNPYGYEPPKREARPESLFPAEARTPASEPALAACEKNAARAIWGDNFTTTPQAGIELKKDCVTAAGERQYEVALKYAALAWGECDVTGESPDALTNLKKVAQHMVNNRKLPNNFYIKGIGRINRIANDTQAAPVETRPAPSRRSFNYQSPAAAA